MEKKEEEEKNIEKLAIHFLTFAYPLAWFALGKDEVVELIYLRYVAIFDNILYTNEMKGNEKKRMKFTLTNKQTLAWHHKCNHDHYESYWVRSWSHRIVVSISFLLCAVALSHFAHLQLLLKIAPIKFRHRLTTRTNVSLCLFVCVENSHFHLDNRKKQRMAKKKWIPKAWRKWDGKNHSAFSINYCVLCVSG